MIPVPEQKIAELIEMMRRYDVFPIFLERLEYSSPGSQHPINPFLPAVFQCVGNYYSPTNEYLTALYRLGVCFVGSQVEKGRVS